MKTDCRNEQLLINFIDPDTLDKLSDEVMQADLLTLCRAFLEAALKRISADKQLNEENTRLGCEVVKTATNYLKVTQDPAILRAGLEAIVNDMAKDAPEEVRLHLIKYLEKQKHES